MSAASIRRPLTVPAREREGRVRRKGAWEPWFVGGLALAAFVVLAPLRAFAVGSLADDGVYVVLGRALANGIGYFAIHHAGTPAFNAYPPGVPLLFAAVWRLAGSLDAVYMTISVLNALAFAAAAALLWWLARARLRVGRLVTACFVIAPFFLYATLHYYSLALSEPWFVLGVAGALVLYECARNAAGTRSGVAAAVAAGLLAALMTLVRLQAVVLLPALILALLVERPRNEPADRVGPGFRRWRAARLAAVSAGGLAPLALWLILNAGAAGSLPHFGWLPSGSAGDMTRLGAQTLLTNYYVYHTQLAHHLGFVAPIGHMFAVAAAVLGAGGAVFLLRSHPAIAITTFAGIATVLLWPFNDFRLLVPLLPFGGLAAAPGVQLLISSMPRRRALLASAALVVVVISVAARQVEFRYRTSVALQTGTAPPSFTLGYGLARNSAHIVETSEWVVRNTTATEPVIAALTAGVFLRTGRPMIESNPPSGLLHSFGPQPFAVPGRYLASAILSQNAAVLVLEHGRLRILQDVALVLRECPGLLVRQRGGVPDRYPAFYRIGHDRTCLHSLTAESATAPAPQPAAAPETDGASGPAHR